MKKILLLSALAASLFAGTTAKAQVRVNVQFGAPAYYEPNGYYANDDDYYYMPDYDAYYSPVRRLYFYNEGGRWMSCGRLPQRFGNIAYGRGNWNRVYGRSPWMNRGAGYYRGGNNGYDNYGGHYNEHRSNRAYAYNNGGYRGGNNGYGNGGYHNNYNNGGNNAYGGATHNFGGNNGSVNNGYHNGNGGQYSNGGNNGGGYHGGNNNSGNGGYHNSNNGNNGGGWNGRH